MTKRPILDSIDVPAPCDKPWDEMTGDDKKRFCLGCKKDVYNLSAMSKKEATRFAAKNAGKICVRYVRLPNGQIFTTDTRLHQITRATAIAAGVAAATMSISSLTYAQGEVIPNRNPSQVSQTQQNDLSKISFTIVDTIGEIIPGAEVKLTNEKTNRTYVITTNDAGIAYFDSLPRARYKIEASLLGFKPNTRYFEICHQVEPNMKIRLEVDGASWVGSVTIIEYEIPLFMAIVQGDNGGVESSLMSGFAVNTKNKNGVTALHVAVQVEELKIAKLLIKNGANVNAQDREGKTPLMMIGEDYNDNNDQNEIVKILLRNGAKVNMRDKKGKTALMYAVDDEIEEFEIVKLLIGAGAKLEKRDKKGNTALLIAADGFSEEIVEYLLKAGANPNVKNKEGETPLSSASTQKEIVEILKRYGANR